MNTTPPPGAGPVMVRPLTAGLSTGDGVDAVAQVCADEPLTMLVNNAGVAHYMPLADLPAGQARELTRVKVVAPTMLTRAAVGGCRPGAPARSSTCPA